MMRVIKPTVSLIEKYGWNVILSIFLLSPIGLLDRVRCKNNKWIITTAAIITGNKLKANERT